MTNKNYIKAAAIAAAVAGLALALPASAATRGPGMMGGFEGGARGGRPAMMRGPGRGGEGEGRGMAKPAVSGTVTAISGTRLTISAMRGFASTTAATSFSVDASAATVFKNAATSTLSSVAVGDRVMIQGTIAGTNVVATVIRDGMPAPRMMDLGARPNGDNGGKDGSEGKDGNEGARGAMMPEISGNGMPVVAGTVSSIFGNSIVISNKSNVQFTIDATNAKVMKGGLASSTLANIAVGDTVVVQGTITGNSVAASSILDAAPRAPAGGSDNPEKPHGFLGGARSFFSHLFGF